MKSHNEIKLGLLNVVHVGMEAKRQPGEYEQIAQALEGYAQDIRGLNNEG